MDLLVEQVPCHHVASARRLKIDARKFSAVREALEIDLEDPKDGSGSEF